MTLVSCLIAALIGRETLVANDWLLLQLDPCKCSRASQISGGLFPHHLIFAHSWMLLTILTKVEPIWMKYHFDKGGKRVGGQLSGWHSWRSLITSVMSAKNLLPWWVCWITWISTSRSKVGVLLRHLESISLTFLLLRAQGHSTGQRSAQGVQGAFLTGHQHCIQHASSPTSWA